MDQLAAFIPPLT